MRDPGQAILGIDRPIVDTFGIVLFDLDGVVYLGQDAIPHAATGLNAVHSAGGRTGFVTNNSSREPESVAEQLRSMGISANPEDIVSSAQAGAMILAEELEPGAKVLVIGGPGLRTAVRKRGFVVVESADDQPAAVIQGFSADLAWRDLAEAAFAIERGARYVATNMDMSLPQERGFAPGNGSLTLAVTSATGVVPVSAGKPEPALYREAISALGGGPAIMVGDRLDTDIAGAHNAEIPSLLVLTGVSTARDVIVAHPADRPSLIASDLRGLSLAHSPAMPDGETGVGANAWVCDDSRAEIVDGRLVVSDAEGDLISVAALRAACAAVWQATDAGLDVDLEAIPNFVVA